jgi:hypothetical protein
VAVVILRDLYAQPGQRSPQRPWQERVLESTGLVLDLSEVSSDVPDPSRIRLDPLQLLLLSNLLTGAKADVGVDVTLPTSTSLLRALARTPLLSAIAHHIGQDQSSEFEPWRRTWNPHDRGQLTEMLMSDPMSAGPAQEGLLTLIDPHRRSVSTLARDVRGIVDPWLNRRFMPEGRTAQQAVALRDVERVMSELTENVGDHAYQGGIGRSQHSICQLYTTRGGGRDSMDRFIITVSDNGIGIPHSVRRHRSDLSGARALGFAIEGKLSHDADRQWGLQNVRGIVERNPGSWFALFTSHLEDRGRSLLCVVDGSTFRIEEWPWMPIFGTVAFVQLALPAPAFEHPTLFDFDGLSPSKADELVSH